MIFLKRILKIYLEELFLIRNYSVKRLTLLKIQNMMAIKEVLLQLIHVQINLLHIQEKGANSEKVGRSNRYAIGKYIE